MCLRLTQAGTLAKDLLKEWLQLAGCYKICATLGLWQHEWRPIVLALVVEYFGVESVGKEHAKHFTDTLRLHHNIVEDRTGEKFIGIDLQWDCTKRTVHFSMKNYIKELLIRFNHLILSKPCHSPHANKAPTCGAKIQHTSTQD